MPPKPPNKDAPPKMPPKPPNKDEPIVRDFIKIAHGEKNLEEIFENTILLNEENNIVLGIASREGEEKEDDALLAIEEQIDVDVRSLETCAYSANTFADILSKIQNMVDELSLRQYSNLQQLVTKLDKEVEKRLASRLQAGIQAWTQAFEGRKEADVDYTMDTDAASAPAVKPDGQPQIPRFIHEIRITNQTMYLHPQLPKSRFYLFQRLLSWQAIVTSLTRIQSPRDQVALDRPTSQTYRDLLTKIPDGPEVLAAAYTAIEGRMKEVKVYVDEWINLQSEKLYGSPKEDISLWIRFLNDIKKSRPIFDTTETRKEFGAVVIDYGQVQSKVALKYDSWHQEVLGKFGAMLGNEMAQFRTHVSESRSELEQQSLEAGSTADAVGLITCVRESLKGKMKALEKQVDTYKEGHRILKGQRFQFPNHWLHINDIEDEWGAFSEIVKRKDDAIQSLQEKIVAEDKAVESRTRDYLENNKPVEGHMRPDEALQRLQLSEIKDSSFKEERDKAKEALEPQETFTDQFGRRERLSSALTSSPNNEDYQDIQDFDEVSEIHDLQNTRSESDSAWFSIIPEEEIKASAENELKTRVVSLEAALHELGRKYQSLQVEIAKLQGCK